MLSDRASTVVSMGETGADRGSGTDRVPTWRDGVPPLRPEEVAALTPEQRDQYLHDSVIRDLAEIDRLPEPWRTRVRAMVEDARVRVEQRIAETEGRQAS